MPPTEESPEKRFEETVRSILHVTSEDYYVNLQQRFTVEEINSKEMMEAMAEMISRIQKQLKGVLWGMFLKIGELITESEDLHLMVDQEEALSKSESIWQQFKGMLCHITPLEEEDELYARSYDIELGRPPCNRVETLLRDTMMYAHRLAEQLLPLLTEKNNEDDED